MTDARASPRATLAELEALADQSVDEPDDRVARAPARLYRPERGQRDQCHPMRGTGVRDDRTCSDAQRNITDADGHIPAVAEQPRTREVDGLYTVTDVRHRGVGPDWDAPRDRVGHAISEQSGQAFSQRFGDLRRPLRSRQETQHQLVAIRQPHGPRHYPSCAPTSDAAAKCTVCDNRRNKAKFHPVRFVQARPTGRPAGIDRPPDAPRSTGSKRLACRRLTTGRTTTQERAQLPGPRPCLGTGRSTDGRAERDRRDCSYRVKGAARCCASERSTVGRLASKGSTLRPDARQMPIVRFAKKPFFTLPVTVAS